MRQRAFYGEAQIWELDRPQAPASRERVDPVIGLFEALETYFLIEQLAIFHAAGELAQAALGVWEQLPADTFFVAVDSRRN